MDKKFDLIELNFLLLDDREEETDNFKFKVEQHNRQTSDAHQLLVHLYTVNKADADEVASLINEKDIDIFICDQNLEECESDKIPDGLHLIDWLMTEHMIYRRDMLYVLYTTSITEKVKNKLQLLEILYVHKDMDNFALTLGKMVGEYNKRFPNRNFKAGTYGQMIASPLDKTYYRYAKILEDDILKNPRQRITIGEKEFTTQLLIDELRRKSDMGQKLVSSYLNSLESIKNLRERT